MLNTGSNIKAGKCCACGLPMTRFNCTAFEGMDRLEVEIFYITKEFSSIQIKKYYEGWKQDFLEHQKYSSMYGNNLEPDL